MEKVKSIILDWISDIDKNEKLPSDIIALNFGLFEPYGIELIGSNEYDEEDEDWACNEDFVPQKRTCPKLPISSDTPWERVLEEITIILKDLVKENKNIRLFQVKHITTGFCDGNLVVIK